jgi:uncharacterized protein (DUF58 family)
MRHSSIKLIAVLALALIVSLNAFAQVAQKPSASASVSLSATRVKPGEEIFAVVSVKNSSDAVEKITIEYSSTEPCGSKTEMGTVSLKLAAGETRKEMLSFLAPAASTCAGEFKVSARVVSEKQELANPSASFTVSKETN